MFVLAPLVNADETHYTVVMSGITWGNCQKDVRGALKTTFQAVNIQIVKKNSKKLKIGFCSINGTGYKPASKLFKKLGISPLYIHSMIRPDPLFSSFKSNQILEPSNSIVYQKVISEFVKEYGKKKLETLDAILFTDPDSDRIGLVCKVPKHQQHILGKYRFVSGNELWTIILRFYLRI